jgi:hypothetical protein
VTGGATETGELKIKGNYARLYRESLGDSAEVDHLFIQVANEENRY